MSFCAFLRSELARRTSLNRRYSLRAFARSLGVDHSTLSQILRGRRTLTPATIRRLAAALRAGACDFAILELAARGHCPADSRALAEVLGVSIDEINVALQRLLRLRLLAMTGAAKWEVTHG